MKETIFNEEMVKEIITEWVRENFKAIKDNEVMINLKPEKDYNGLPTINCHIYIREGK